jgi:cytochrome c peroxidase
MPRIIVIGVTAAVLAATIGGYFLAAENAATAVAGRMSSELPAVEKYKAAYQRPSAVPFPPENPYTADKYELGELLFFDPRLSGNNYISCANCHNPSLSWGDALPKGIGHGMTVLGRRTPTILNLAWAELLMWDGRKSSLEEQALGPIAANVEMNQDLTSLVAEMAVIEEYVTRFEKTFPDEGLTAANIGKAIATYERTVVSGTAPFDRWIAGDEQAISASAKRGFLLFNTKANCAVCHSGWNFTDNSFHDIGLKSQDIGRYEHLPLSSMKHAFKTPTLRDTARRAPYMHDGSIKSLEDVVRHYDTGAVARESLSPEVHPLGLTDAEVRDLVEFMMTLDGDDKPVRMPRLPMTSQRSADGSSRATH